MRFGIRHLLLTLLGLGAIGAAWFFLAPGALGGSTSYVITHGNSMEPRFSSGDLVLLRESSGYHVGDVAAYRSEQLHTIVLHRIVAVDGGRYVFKGDHNTWRDPEHVSRSQLVGTLWLRLPGVGGALKRAGTPANVAILAGVAVLLLAGGAGVATRRRRRRRAGAAARRPRPAAQGVQLALGGSAVVLVAALALGAAAYARPTQGSAAGHASYSQHGAFSYAASAMRGDVYPTGQVGTGDAVFARLVHRVRVSFDYRFRATAPHALTGRASLDAVLSASTGWQRTLVLQAPTAVSGDRIVLSGGIALGPLERLLTRVETATGDAAGVTYTLAIAPHLQLSGSLTGKQVRPSFAPQLQFGVDKYALRPLLTGFTGNPLRPAAEGSVGLTRHVPRTISFRAFDLSVATARKVAIAAGGAALAVMLLCALLLLRGRRADEPERIRALYGRWLVPISRSERRSYDEVVEVTSMETLVRLAERYDRMILHEQTELGHSYRLADDGVLYAYLVGDPGFPAPAEAAEEPAPEQESRWGEAPPLRAVNPG